MLRRARWIATWYIKPTVFGGMWNRFPYTLASTERVQTAPHGSCTGPVLPGTQVFGLKSRSLHEPLLVHLTTSTSPNRECRARRATFRFAGFSVMWIASGLAIN